MDSSALIWCDVNSLARLSCLASFPLSSSRMTSRLRWKKNCFVMTWKSIVLTSIRFSSKSWEHIRSKGENMRSKMHWNAHFSRMCSLSSLQHQSKFEIHIWALSTQIEKNREFNHLISRNFFKNYVKENFVVFELWTKNKIKKVSWNQFY